MIITKKCQSSIEFVILVGVIFFFFTVFFMTIQEKNADKIIEKKNLLVKETAYAIQDEINLAQSSGEGYTREFKLPERLDNWDYDVILVDNSVYVKTKDNRSAIALPIARVTGNIVKGDNVIRKLNNSIQLN